MCVCYKPDELIYASLYFAAKMSSVEFNLKITVDSTRIDGLIYLIKEIILKVIDLYQNENPIERIIN